MADELRYVCPECIQGKCNNCNGIANFDVDDNAVPCSCKAAAHPHRMSHADRASRTEYEPPVILLETREDQSKMDIGGIPHVISQNISLVDRHIIEEKWVPLPGLPKGALTVADGTPEADPGELAFTVEDGRPYGEDIRLRPDAQINKDFLMDVEVKNDRGEWVPAIPTPIFLAFGRVQCHCGKKRRNKLSYMEHFSYAHILGMDD